MERFIVKTQREPGDKRSPYVVADEIAVMHPMIYRDSGRRIGGVFTELEATGRHNKTRFEIAVRKGRTARGVESSRSRDRAEADATAAGIKRVCRRLRPQEATRIAAIDDEIATIETDLREAKDRRVKVVREAFAKGHVVRLAEMRAWASTAGDPADSGGQS